MKGRRLGVAVALFAVAAALLSTASPAAFAFDDVVEGNSSTIVARHTQAHLVAGSRPKVSTRAIRDGSHRFVAAATSAIACVIAAGAIVAARRTRRMLGVVARPALGRAPPLRLI